MAAAVARPTPPSAQGWSTALMQKLYSERPRFCDVAIECTASNDLVYAHRAVLAARTQYFYHAFLGTVGAADGATMVVETHHRHEESNIFGTLDAHPETGAIASPQPELRRSGRVFFRESSTVLERIVEFMYLGQIAMLEESVGCPSEDQYNTWMWLLTWSFKHKVMDLFRYILGHLLRMQLSPTFAARLLDLQIDTATSRSVSMRTSSNLGDDDRSDYAPLLERLRAHAAETFTKATFEPKIFQSLNRSALLIVLQECSFGVPEAEVIGAIRHWTQESEWVRSTYSDNKMPAAAVHTLMEYVDPRCLTAQEFFANDDMFSEDVQDWYTDEMFKLHSVNPNTVRIASSPICHNRAELRKAIAYGPVPVPVPPPGGTGAVPPVPGPSTPGPQPRKPATPPPHVEGTGIAVPVPTDVKPDTTPDETLAAMDENARMDPSRPETAFLKGRSLFLAREANYRTLVSLESSTYQGMMYRGSVCPGALRWSLEVVRRCDMFWMGVTSNPQLDMSGMIGRDHKVWMISEEGTCLDHCRNVAVTVAQPIKARINLLFVNCFKCVEQPPEAWDKVVMELNTAAGNLFITVNNGRKQHLFKNLPTNRALYPCMMAVNTGQAHFELLDARRY